ncbi:uncharacterized protein PHACADRAFT_259140 [Phanerochaete carnosa HHB-10118-sp]|uniref:Uncharacterized protein n=1 Tax=Phanerochaete carnosa (strain HHB-10118-sp) TaxID=650164 RepID=K5W248_PHACS|nr:uncharacterized protein PHACADRAFT_259140 [Phanerochaete carnosa HHB-10118-sp]EKM52964.1 hypothetical protein PHACADRAFT_259140 [Phanerochaete carnosa HHB-10118-sp]
MRRSAQKTQPVTRPAAENRNSASALSGISVWLGTSYLIRVVILGRLNSLVLVLRACLRTI